MLDLSRIEFIKESKIEELKDIKYLENLIIKLGFNNEILHEQPSIVKENGGGLLIWQYPNQFSKYLKLLSEQKITSYIEIGCRWGGTFILTNEYLKKFNNFKESLAVDIIDSPVKSYCEKNENTNFLKMSSTSNEFKNFMENKNFDLCFIDGDHSYEGVLNDYNLFKDKCKIYVFHDIVNEVCPGVIKLWNELKKNNEDKFNFYEFVEQYDDVLKATNKKYLGIGVAIVKDN